MKNHVRMSEFARKALFYKENQDDIYKNQVRPNVKMSAKRVIFKEKEGE